MAEYDVSALVGIVVPLVFQWLKKLKWINDTGDIEKQTMVAVLAAVGVGTSVGWKIDLHVASQMAVAALIAWATYKGILKKSEAPAVVKKAK